MKRYIKILLRHQRPLRFLIARVLAKSGLCRMFKIDQDGYRLHFHSANLSEQLWIQPQARTEALQFFRDYIKLGDCVIDVGANIGDTALTASICVGRKGRVWALEPHPRTFRFLEENLILNDINNVQTINCAVGDATDEVLLSDDRRDDMNRIGVDGLTVPLRTLDDLIPHGECIQLLKVDVEGYEKLVLLGAREVLENVDCVHIEISNKHFAWYGYSIPDLLQFLQSKGFELFSIPQNGRFKEVDSDYETTLVENLIATRDPIGLVDRTKWLMER